MGSKRLVEEPSNKWPAKRILMQVNKLKQTISSAGYFRLIIPGRQTKKQNKTICEFYAAKETVPCVDMGTGEIEYGFEHSVVHKLIINKQGDSNV